MCVFLLDLFWLITNDFLLLEGFVDLFKHRLIIVYFRLTTLLHVFERCIVI